MSEVRLKAALLQSKSDDAARQIIAENRPIGLSIMDFAAKHGRFDIAASLAPDGAMRFEMTLLAGDLDTAAAAADEIGNKDIFQRLAAEGMAIGRFRLAEDTLKKSGDTEQLALLYLLSGDSQKLQKLAKQTGSVLHYLWANDDEALAKIFSEVAPALEVDLTGSDLHVNHGKNVLEDWPMTRTGFIHTTIAAAVEDIDDAGWGWDLGESGIGKEEEDGGWEVDIDIATPALSTTASAYVPPSTGLSVHRQWVSRCQTAGELAAAGAFGEALLLLDQSIAVRNTDILKSIFIEAYVSANGFVSDLIVPLSAKSRGGRVSALRSPLEFFEEVSKLVFGSFAPRTFAKCSEICPYRMRRNEGG
jgi:coatomer protein complex subunit alpha (xenin)